MKVKVKICGIKSYEDAKMSIEAGADFLGLNFVPKSARFINPVKAYEVISKLSDEIKIVGIFQNETIENVQSVTDYLKLDFVQLHGEEPVDYFSKIKNTKLIKTFKLFSDFNQIDILEQIKDYTNTIFLLDRKIQGEGYPLELERVKYLTGFRRIILGGGLTPENVREAVIAAYPYGVDVAGGVETDGKKDKEKIRRFIINAKYE